MDAAKAAGGRSGWTLLPEVRSAGGGRRGLYGVIGRYRLWIVGIASSLLFKIVVLSETAKKAGRQQVA